MRRHRERSGCSDAPEGRGLALREVLLSLLEPRSEEIRDPREERLAALLRQRFLERRSPEWVREQLHLSRSSFFEEQRRALDLLADRLRREGELLRRETRRPRPLPPGPEDLSGREDLRRGILRRLLGERPLLALWGLPGVGKTALALDAARHPDLRERYPDGILWAPLGPEGSPSEVLQRWASDLGLSPERIRNAPDGEALGALAAEALGNRRCLLVLDDLWDPLSARLLRAGGKGCGHLLTTRLAEVALEFAGPRGTLRVPELDPRASRELLESFLPPLEAPERKTLGDLAEASGGLPLALVLMGRRLRGRGFPGQPRRFRAALEELRDPSLRLDLEGSVLPERGEIPVSLRWALERSEGALSPAAREALGSLSLLPPKPASFAETVALAVAGTGTDSLDERVDAGLLEPQGGDRYALHQTVRDFAALRGPAPGAAIRLAEAGETLARTLREDPSRDLEYPLLERAFEAARSEGSERLRPLLLELHDLLELRGLYDAAQDLLERAASSLDPEDRAGEIQGLLGGLDLRRGRFPQALERLRDAARRAREAGREDLEVPSLFHLGLAAMYAGEGAEARDTLRIASGRCLLLRDPRWEGYGLNALGFLAQELGDYPQARRWLLRALRTSPRSRDLRNRQWAHMNLGMVCLPRGDFLRGERHTRLALGYALLCGDRRGQAWSLYQAGRTMRLRGRLEEAEDLFRRTLGHMEDLGEGMGGAFALHNLGLVRCERTRGDRGREEMGEALDRFRRLRCRTGESCALHSLGTLAREQGDPARSLDLLDRALEIRRSIANLRGEGKTRCQRALTLGALGRIPEARAEAALGLGIARRIGAEPDRAFGLLAAGWVHRACGRVEAARDAFRRSLALRRRLGQPHREEAPRRALEALD